MMGTFVEVTSSDPLSNEIVFKEISRIENLISKYKPESEISQLNSQGRFAVSPEVKYLLLRAKEFWLASDGAFDITVGPLMDLWGFTTKKFRQPADDEIRAAMQFIGTNKIIFQPTNNVVEFNLRGMEVDLGAIGKGYALDCAIAALQKAGIKNCLINAGGQIHCLGFNDGKPWRVAVKNPRGKDMVEFIELTNKAVATSGDYEQFFIAGDKRYSHIMNPKTGYPSESGVISATVIAEDGITADFLATSIVVLGKGESLTLLKRFPDTQAKIIEQEK
jgi:thiamine biosynthesis lipoprotein